MCVICLYDTYVYIYIICICICRIYTRLLYNKDLLIYSRVEPWSPRSPGAVPGTRRWALGRALGGAYSTAPSCIP